ncbi:MAG: aminotransferase class V-fold PLP-dependent enzyme [Burkholderiales bacterium]|jgi:glutamate/tyrosine decarboxylase-like PLP-dependent enzyme
MTDEYEALRRALDHAITHLESLDAREIPASVSASELRNRLGKELGEEGVAAEQVIDELAADVAGGLFGSGSPRFFAWAIGGALPASIAADWLTSAWDQVSAIYSTSPALAVMEEVAGTWLKDILRLPQDASFAFVTGCQSAHMTALAAARHKLLHDRGYDVEAHGLSGAPKITIHTGELCHESIARAARFLGLGTESVKTHPCHEDGRLDLDHVARSLDDSPTILVLQAGEFNTGAFDDFHRAHELAHAHGMWVHVDGALGLWVATSERYRHLMDGCELMDSWATDGHKWLNLPYDVGFVFTAQPQAHKQAMTIRASYFSAGDDMRHQIDWGPEWSRRGRGVPVYAALRSLGRRGLAQLVDRCCEHAQHLVNGIGALEGAEVVAAPVINQGVVRFTADDGDHDRRTDEVIERIQESGIAWFGGANFKGQRVMRVPVLNWRTTGKDVETVIDVVRRALQA